MDAAAAAQGIATVETFDGLAEGTQDTLETVVGKFSGPDRSLRVRQRLGEQPGNYALRLGASRDGKKMPTIEVRLDLPQAALQGTVLSMDIQRAARRKRFQLEVEFVGGPDKSDREDLTSSLVIGEFRPLGLAVPAGTTAVLFHLTAPPTIGVDLDNLEILAPKPMGLVGLSARHITQPVFLSADGDGAPVRLAELRIDTDGVLEPKALESIRLQPSVDGAQVVSVSLLDEAGVVLAEAEVPADQPPGETWVTLEPKWSLVHGANAFVLSAEVIPRVAPEGHVMVQSGEGTDRFALAGAPISLAAEVTISGESPQALPWTGTPARTAAALGPVNHDVLGTALIPVRGALGTPSSLLAALTVETERGPRIRFTRPSTGGALQYGKWLRAGLDEEWDTFAPTLIQERPKGTVHAFFMVRIPDRPKDTEIWRTRSEDGGDTWADATKLEWSTPSSVRGPEGGPLDLLGGRGLQSRSGPWVLLTTVPGEAAHRLLLSKDQGKTFELSESSEVPGQGGALVELGPGAFLVDTYLPGSNRRYLVSTNSATGAWSDALSKRRPLLPCAGLGATIIHVGLDVSGGADWRLIFANVAKGPGAAPGLTVRGSNDNGDNWFDRVALVLDEASGADLPALAVLDSDTVCVLYRSSRGQACVQYLELSEVVEKVTTFFDVFGAGSDLKR